MCESYLNTLEQQTPSAELTTFMVQADRITLLAKDDHVSAVKHTMTTLMPAWQYNTLAQKITLMWYLGQWFDDPSDGSSATQINGRSYIQSLVWPAANTHPPGAKHPGFGSWSVQPLSAHRNDK
ncbi:hypothetical protein [Shewanella sp. YLB-07]|uniref:hypothetical protein n=1 Tax=Shewanella sp. YLB-07 TaxID=2601268 RepID=UPI00128AF2F0|nr:hypothetical protein [Shewanella sp. YLB-07]MPY24572.1 hypothetical protein [Shewanella sp. YLB-07]